MNLTTKKTMEVIAGGKKVKGFRVNSLRVNEILRELNLPYHIESHKKGKGMRSYELVNEKKQASIEFDDIWSVILDTPLQEIIKSAKEDLEKDKSFWAELTTQKQEATVKKAKGKKAA